jgi:2-dehydropantoate 2-reductase
MRIAIFGTGGIGGYFGGCLALSGEDVTFIARGEHLRAIRERGLRVESVTGDFTVHPAQATDNPAQVGPVEIVIVAVKGWQVADAAEAMRPLIGPKTLVVPLLNGVEAPDQLAASLGPDHVAGGLCGLFGALVAPGHIRNNLPAPFVTIGELDNARTERIQRLRDALARSGVKADIAPDIRAALWEKLLFVGPFGGVGAVTRAPVGVFRALPETRRMLEQAMREIFAVARARQIAVADDAIARALAMIDNSPAAATASMQRDILAGRPSELASQVGAVVRLGLEVGAEAPIHTFINSSLLPLEMRARGDLTFPD